jgi:protein TonB
MKRMILLSAVMHGLLLTLLVAVSYYAIPLAGPAVEVRTIRLVTAEILRPEPPKQAAPAQVRLPEPVPKKNVVVKPKKSPEKPPVPAPPPQPPPAAEPTPAEEKPPVTADVGPAVSSIKATTDPPEFQFPFYLRLVQKKVGESWSPPSLSFMENGAEEVVVRFVIGRRGAVSSVRVEKSSGSEYYDQAALRAVYRSSPLPPLPEGFEEESLTVHFSFLLQRPS